MRAWKSCSTAARSSRARAGTTGAGGCPTSSAAAYSRSTPTAAPRRCCASTGGRPGSAGSRTARCSSSRCSTGACSGATTAAGSTVHADLRELCDGHANDLVVTAEGRAYVGNFGFDLDHDEPRPTRLVRVDPDGSAQRGRGRAAVPERIGRHPRRPDADRRRDLRPPLHRLLDRGGRHARAPSRLGRPARRADRARTAARSTRRAGSGLPTRGTGAAAASPRAARCSTRSRCRTGCAASPACSAATTGARCSSARAPDYEPSRRRARREAVLLTTRVEVPHAGLP